VPKCHVIRICSYGRIHCNRESAFLGHQLADISMGNDDADSACGFARDPGSWIFRRASRASGTRQQSAARNLYRLAFSQDCDIRGRIPDRVLPNRPWLQRVVIARQNENGKGVQMSSNGFT
jgi:hypothetical protein